MWQLCEASRSVYYDYVKRMDISAWDLLLAEKIQEFQNIATVPMATIEYKSCLERQGIHKNPKTDLHVMQKCNLLSAVLCKKYRNYGEYLHRYPNLLSREFHAERPNQKWVTDISYIETG